MRRRLALLCLAGAVLLPAAPAAAAPVSYFPVPGSAGEPISNLTASSAGTLWVAQQLATGPSNEERLMRLLHFGPAGNLLAATPTQVGDPVFSELAPASDGGVWVLAFRSLRHVSPDGTVTEVNLPQTAFPEDLVAGGDGRAWVQTCRLLHDVEPRREECQVIAVSNSGQAEFFPAPELEIEWPAGATQMSGASWSFPVQGGAWFAKFHHFPGEPEWSGDTAFVSHSGAVQPVDLPPNAFPVEGANGTSAWWIREYGVGGATIGQVSTAGIISNTQQMVNVSAIEPPDGFSTEGGRNGNLLWAQNATWSEVVDGQLGVRRVDGSSSTFQVPLNATAVLIDQEANFWSGSCTFGVKLHEAVDGSIWTLSFGHPTRITRQQLSGEFSVFLIGDAASREAEQGGFFGTNGMVESDSRSLWFTMNTPTGPQLARLDPLDPPPAEVKYPGPRRTSEFTSISRRQRVVRLLKSLLAQSERALLRQRRLWLNRERPGVGFRPIMLLDRRPRLTSLRERKGSFRVLGRFPAAGRATITFERRGRQRRLVVLAFGTREGEPGRRVLTVRLKPAGRKLMRLPVEPGRLTLSASFEIEGAGKLRKSLRVRLP